MKSFIALALLVTSFASFAGTIANCPSNMHHGRDLEIKDDNKKITLGIYSDGEDTERIVEVKSITKSGAILKDPGAMSWAIRQAIKGSRDVDQSGTILIKVKAKDESYVINLNTFTGGNYMVINDYVYDLNCQQ